MSADETIAKEAPPVLPSDAFRAKARVGSHAAYAELHRHSVEEPLAFWKEHTRELAFRTPITSYVEWKAPHAKFFTGTTLNVSESCLDRHLTTGARNRAAIVWEGEPGEVRTLTYFELHREVVRLAAALTDLGVKAGDRVAIYLGMVPEAAIAMLACARLGAPHTVIFGGFSSDALRDRIKDCGCKVLLTQDGAYRRGSVVPLKKIADQALEDAPSIEKVVMFRRIADESKAPTNLKAGRDLDWNALLDAKPSNAAIALAKAPAAFDAEHPLFILYTSGSTGKPKGVQHSSAGFLAGVHVTTKYVFDLQEGDLYWCTADVGWITGHSYFVYGPLSCGASCMMYEGAPNFPDAGRFWKVIERHGVTILYTAPTAIRSFIRAGDAWPNGADLSSLRLLGSVGEPINPEAWLWYHRVIGGGRCPIVDTWWQTETGAIMLTTLPGACLSKPGTAGLPLFGVDIDVVKDDGSPAKADEEGKLIIKSPWPSMARTLYNDDDRFKQAYWSQLPGVYFTGDGAKKDADGYIRVTGRIDDVLNVAGHRIGTAEIESALVSHAAVAEAAVVGKDDELKGSVLVAFVTLKQGQTADAAMKKSLSVHVEVQIGKFARPEQIRFADALPKTRSGKIMRRLLKEVAGGQVETKGDTSTLEDLSVLAKLRADED
jgi:acetyl-CoA synthetase